MSDALDYSAFTGKFIEETRDHLKELNNHLLTLESNPDDEEAMNAILREAHTLKGSARMIEANDIAEIAHKVEDVLIDVRDKKLELDRDVANLIFTSFDSIELLLHSLAGEPGQEEGVDVEALCKKLSAVRGGAQAPPKAKSHAEAETTEKPVTKPKKPTKETPTALDDTVRVSASRLDQLVNLMGEMVINQTRMQERLKDLKDLSSELRVQSRQWKALRDKMDKLGTSDPLSQDLDLLDAERAETEKEARQLMRRWLDDTTQMDTIIADLEEEILEARMLPISTLFDTFRRSVRDMSREFGKEIELTIEGGDTRLDKKMIEMINAPLIHLVRNAVDHGIEKPGEREGRGKSRQGTVRLSARQEGDNVVIEVADDGAGIDPEAVKKAAIERKLIDEHQAKEMSDRDAMELLFRSGFSTRSQVTDISGRGVGMDVVKRNIEEIKGMVNFTSEPGKGTTVILKVPLTIAVIRVLLVKVGKHRFALPTTTIEETLRIKPGDIKVLENKEAVILRECPLALVRMNEILKIDDGHEASDAEVFPVVVISFAGTRIGFIVDELAGEQQVVIKTLGGYLEKVENVAGATIMGSGDVVPILNVPDLINAARSAPVHTEVKPVTEAEEAAPRRVLVVDDALTTRELEKHILESAGYEVDTAIDGLDALEKVAQKRYDLFIVDIQMPRLDGFELTKRLKTAEKYRDVPVVIVTTLDKEEDRRRGIEIGADVYITKSDFGQANLLDTIERLIG